MRSWSKYVIFSRSWKSSRIDGPRSPALSEWSVSGMRRPCAVVRYFPGLGARVENWRLAVGVPGRTGRLWERSDRAWREAWVPGWCRQRRMWAVTLEYPDPAGRKQPTSLSRTSSSDGIWGAKFL